MRTWIAASTAAALIAAWGCSAPSQKAEPEGKPAPAPEQAEPKSEAKPVAPGQTAGAEWEEILKKLKANYEVGEQAKASQADEHYRLAERYYQAGDFEKAELECEKAIQINPNHAAAQALVTEVRFILGKGGATPASREYDKYMQEAIVRHQQTLVEIDNAHARGTRHYNRGEYD